MRCQDRRLERASLRRLAGHPPCCVLVRALVCMQVYLALSRLLAGDGAAPLQALAEAEADLAALAPDAARARVRPTDL